jgi:CheY-like chemotaxis protein
MAKVIIVDDNKIITGIYKNKLEQAGYAVEVAYDGRTGLDLIVKTRPDLVLLDLMLPEIPGAEVLRNLRRREEFRELPVVVFSSAYGGAEVEKARQNGATRILAKANITPNQIAETIREVLSAAAPAPPAAEPAPAPTPPPAPPPVQSGTGPLSADALRAARQEPERAPEAGAAGRVLVLEDDPVVMTMLKGTLEREGYTAVTAVDGREAYRILERDANFVAGIFDVMVPFINGPDLVQYMRTERRLMNIPVILTSAHTRRPADTKETRGAPVQFLPKPFTRAQLQALLRSVLDTHRGGSR